MAELLCLTMLWEIYCTLSNQSVIDHQTNYKCIIQSILQCPYNISKAVCNSFSKCNKSLFSYPILTILAHPVVSDTDFIIITGNILRSVNDVPFVKTGNIVLPGSAPYILL